VEQIVPQQVLCGLRVHGSATRDKRAGGHGAAAVCERTAEGQAVSVLRTANRPNQGAILYVRRVCATKRLNNGAIQWPRTASELRLLDVRNFRWLIEGLQIDQPKAIQKKQSKVSVLRESKRQICQRVFQMVQV